MSKRTKAAEQTAAPADDRVHMVLVLKLRNITRQGYATDLISLLAKGGTITLPALSAGNDQYRRHIMVIQGSELGPSTVWYDGTRPGKILLAVHGWLTTDITLTPAKAHAITGTHLRGYRLDVAETGYTLTWGEVDE